MLVENIYRNLQAHQGERELLLHQLAEKRWGDSAKLTVRRGSTSLTKATRAASMPYETTPGLDVAYGEVASAKGYRIRTYTTRPTGAHGRLPVIVFIPWLSCDAVEQPFGPRSDGWAKMLRAVLLGAPVQFVRIE